MKVREKKTTLNFYCFLLIFANWCHTYRKGFPASTILFFKIWSSEGRSPTIPDKKLCVRQKQNRFYALNSGDKKIVGKKKTVKGTHFFHVFFKLFWFYNKHKSQKSIKTNTSWHGTTDFKTWKQLILIKNVKKLRKGTRSYWFLFCRSTLLLRS